MKKRTKKNRKHKIKVAFCWIGVILVFVLAYMNAVFIGEKIGNKRYEDEIATYSVTEDVPIVNIAVEQIGNRKGKKFWSWYNYGSRVSWCACFVSWCENKCGYLKSDSAPKFASCSDGIKWFKEHGQWSKGSTTPEAGDIIFFDWNNNKAADHVGIVTGVVDGKVFTIEGNSSDRCRRKRYEVGSKVILGYGKIVAE